MCIFKQVVIYINDSHKLKLHYTTKNRQITEIIKETQRIETHVRHSKETFPDSFYIVVKIQQGKIRHIPLPPQKTKRSKSPAHPRADAQQKYVSLRREEAIFFSQTFCEKKEGTSFFDDLRSIPLRINKKICRRTTGNLGPWIVRFYDREDNDACLMLRIVLDAAKFLLFSTGKWTTTTTVKRIVIVIVVVRLFRGRWERDTEEDKSAGCRCCSFAGGGDASSGVWTHAATTCSTDRRRTTNRHRRVPASGIFKNSHTARRVVVVVPCDLLTGPVRMA